MGRSSSPGGADARPSATGTPVRAEQRERPCRRPGEGLLSHHGCRRAHPPHPVRAGRLSRARHGHRAVPGGRPQDPSGALGETRAIAPSSVLAPGLAGCRHRSRSCNVSSSHPVSASISRWLLRRRTVSRGRWPTFGRASCAVRARVAWKSPALWRSRSRWSCAGSMSRCCCGDCLPRWMKNWRARKGTWRRAMHAGSDPRLSPAGAEVRVLPCRPRRR